MSHADGSENWHNKAEMKTSDGVGKLLQQRDEGISEW